MTRFILWINNSFFEDRERWVLWIPVLFALGIVFYFFFPSNSSFLVSFLLFLSAIFLACFLKEESSFLLVISIVIFLSGYLWSRIYTTKIAYTPIIKHKLYALAIGRIDDISYFYNPILKRSVPKITITNLDLYKVDKSDKELFEDISKTKHQKKISKKKKSIVKKTKRKRRKKSEIKIRTNYGDSEFINSSTVLEKEKSVKKKLPKSKNENKTVIRNYLNLNGYQEIDRSIDDFYFDESEWNGSKYIASPRKIVINVNTKYSDIKVGDLIKTAVVLEPLRKINMIGGYDFAFDSYFKAVGATGYAASKIKVIKPAKHFEFNNDIKFLRQKIARKIFDAIGYNQASIAVALLVGLQNYIPEELMINIRNSGLTHLLSISGLHLTLACGIFFFFIRFCLSLNSYLVLNYNIKKIAAFISIGAGMFYLLLAGMPVPAIRSFVMVSLVFLAVIFDKLPNPHRSISLAAGIILIISPNVIFSVSFQFSFAAILALITVYDFSKKYNLETGNKPFYHKLFFYLIGIIISSIAVELVIAPLSIYHFNNFIAYSVLANLFAIPLTSFITMPLGFLSLFLMPFGLEKLALILMSYSIDMVIDIANFVSSLPYAIKKISMISSLSFGLILFGGLWFCLWNQKWRYLAIISIIIGIYFSYKTPLPNLLIDEERRYFAVWNDQDGLVFSKQFNHLSFKQKEWMQKTGEGELKFNSNWCNDLNCLVEIEKKKILFLTGRNRIDFICKSDADLMVNMTKKYQLPDCLKNKSVINNLEFQKNGSYFLYLSDGQIKKVATASLLSRMPKNY